MYLKQSKNSKSGRIYLSCVYGYRDASGRSRTKTYRSFGYLDELAQRYEDPIAHFKEVVKGYNADKGPSRGAKAERPPRYVSTRDFHITTKNLGYSVPYVYYNHLDIESLWKNVRQEEHLLFDLNAIFRRFIMLRALEPTAGPSAPDGYDRIFERSSASSEQLFQSIKVFARHSERFYRYLTRHLEELCDFDRETGYCGLYTMYFGLGNNAEAKDRRRQQRSSSDTFQYNFIVDAHSMPLCAELQLPYERSPFEHYQRLEQIRRQNRLGRIITVSDIGVPSLDHFSISDPKNNGFIITMDSERCAPEIQRWVLNNAWDTDWYGDLFKNKVFELQIPQYNHKGQARTVKLPVKLVCCFSKPLAEAARQNLQNHLSEVLRIHRRNSSDQGEEGRFEKELRQIQHHEMFSGYLLLATTETDRSSIDIASIYRRYARHRRMFYDLKQFSVPLPGSFSYREHIAVHFMTCFFCSVLYTMMQQATGGAFTLRQINQELASFNVVNVQENLWFVTHWSETTSRLLESAGLKFSPLPMPLSEIRHQISVGAYKPLEPASTFQDMLHEPHTVSP
ncbi:MAG: hypothetical protein LBL67_01575 [Coriobacteriales bacterium]|jgi:hypothetical protein|nr:hypothetical protein [Coriobacteriales bacterium]